MSDKARANTEQMRTAGDDTVEPVDTAPRFSPTSQRRRSLMRAAASCAPLVATLPSGAALAQASALQCVIQEQDGSKERPPGATSEPRPPEDTYMRALGFSQTYFSFTPVADGGAGQGFVVVYQYTVNGQIIRIVGDNSDVTGTPPDLPPMGTWFETNLPNPPLLLNGPDGTETSFLLMYKADPNPITSAADVSVGSNGLPDECIIANDFPAWPGPGASPPTPETPTSNNPQYCFYPIAVQADVNDAGNIPLTTSCLASFRQ